MDTYQPVAQDTPHLLIDVGLLRHVVGLNSILLLGVVEYVVHLVDIFSA